MQQERRAAACAAALLAAWLHRAKGGSIGGRALNCNCRLTVMLRACGRAGGRPRLLQLLLRCNVPQEQRLAAGCDQPLRRGGAAAAATAAAAAAVLQEHAGVHLFGVSLQPGVQCSG